MNGWEARAEKQYGTISRAQLRPFELTDRQIQTLSSSRLELAHRGVFRVKGSYPSGRQKVMAALLACGDDALTSFETCGSLLRLPTKPDLIDISVPHARKRSLEGVRLHRTNDIGPRDRYEVDGIPCTSPTRTIIDLAARVRGEELEYLFETARRMGLVTATVLAHRFEPLAGKGRPGSAALRELLTAADGRPKESKLEVRAARLLRENGISPEVTQHRVLSFRLDFAWVRRLLAIECDGFDWHGNRLAWKRDRRRIAALEALGWRICHLTWDDVTKHKTETLQRVRLFLAS